ncbi:MAG: MFS transporter [Actinomycetota bacterium]
MSRAPHAAAPSGAPRPTLVTPVFVLVTFSTFAYFVAIGVLLPTLPLYVRGPLGGGPAAVGLAVGAFAITSLVLRPFMGRIGDTRGRRVLLLAGGALAAASSAGYVVAGSLAFVVAFRLLAGVAEACFFVGAAAAINDLAPDERRGEAVSLFSLALYGALAVGPVLGEFVLDRVSFDAVWLVSATAGAVAVLLAIAVPDTRTAIVADPPRSRIVNPAAVRPGLVLVASIWGFAGFSAFAALYARSLGLSGSQLVFVEFAVIVLLIRSVGARLPDRLGFVRCAQLALAANAVGLAVMGLWQTPAGLFTGTAMFAVGQGLAFPALMSLAVGAAPASERGSVVGTFTAFFDLSYGVGAATLGGVAAALGYGQTLVAGALVAVVGFVPLAGIREPDRMRGPDEGLGVEGVEDPAG